MGKLEEASEAYLAFHGLTPEAVAHVDAVIDKFEWMIDLAIHRAQQELATPPLPDNVVLLHPTTPVDITPKLA